ncbi:MAG: (Fe-S)-binding protein [Actinobacteria bacterium]|nr:(Fe-S)-binding protein [Actinomycetota bacterium]MBU1944988.1 (Fe-S)-binding protein [Actinomycetota bacterium]MBU2688469.1 (Fe-S)-binding protein [Actinomycetota bacterium]
MLGKTLEDYEKDMTRCARCSLCKWPPLAQVKSIRYSQVCPAISKYNFHSYSGGGKMIIGLSKLRGRVDYSEEMLNVIYRCSVCGACDISCKYSRDLEPLEILHTLRATCVKDGVAPLPAHRPILDSMRNYDNVWQQPRKKKGSWAKKLDVKNAKEQPVDTLYFAGCTYSLRPEMQGIARTTVEVLQSAGVDLGILGEEELCCGSPAYTIGDEELFVENARKNIKALNSLGVRRVVTSCAGCFGVLKTKYPLVEPANFEVVNVTELLAELVEQGRLSFSRPLDRTITYHDPCHLGRQSETYKPWHGVERKVLNHLVIQDPPKEFNRGTYGVYEAPRKVLAALPGLELTEMERIREFSFCCGSGGGAKSAFPEFALATARERVDEAESTGAEMLVTACPWCESNLSEGIADAGSRLKSASIIELVSYALGGGELS